MAMFAKPEEYITRQEVIRLLDLHERKDMYVTRPPYQRKVVWKPQNQTALLDSVFRGYYIPRLVLRRVLVDDGIKYEVIDGQQRIAVIQKFFNDEIRLPFSLRDVREDLPYKTYSSLPDDAKAFIDHEQYEIDMIYQLEDPRDVDNQRIVTGIFRRLQEGESLTNMEKNHARLNSLVRNFLVKYADDIGFDFGDYQPLDFNESKHEFFTSVYRGTNKRMQHLAFLCRLLIVEEADGPADLRDSVLSRFIARFEEQDGIGNFSFETEDIAQNVLHNMELIAEIFDNVVSEILTYSPRERHGQYLTLSIYLLIRHLNNIYVIDDDQKRIMGEFLAAFYRKWLKDDSSVWRFDRNSQNDKNAIATRHDIICKQFFEFADKAQVKFLEKSSISEV